MRSRPFGYRGVALALFVGAAGACQLFNGIGNDLAYQALDASQPAEASPDATTSSGSADGSPDVGAEASPGDVDAGKDADAGQGVQDAEARVDGDAGPDGDSGPDASPGTRCPEAGAAMVRIDVPDAGSFCIDTTEVTQGEFEVYWRTHAPGTVGSELPAICYDAGLGTTPADPDTTHPDMPMTLVSFCFAWDYCASIGKRMCGELGGGHAQSIQSSEWYYACSNGRETAYPYGDVYSDAICVTDGGSPVDVGTWRACHGTKPPFDAIFDMSGNVVELYDNAELYDPQQPLHNVGAAGGRYGSGSVARCDDDVPEGVGTPGTLSPPEIGFRCCADLR